MTEFRQRFNVDPKVSEFVLKERNKQLLGIVVGVIALVLAFLFGILQDEYWYDQDARELLNILKFGSVAVGLLEVILSPIVLYLNSKTSDKLHQTHVTVYNDKVTGISYNNPTVGIPFELSYTDIIEAEVLPDNVPANSGNNIKIVAGSGIYFCYAIEQKSTAVALINEKKAKFDENAAHSTPVCTGDAAVVSERAICYCIYCGTELTQASVFCHKCGKEQKQ